MNSLGERQQPLPEKTALDKLFNVVADVGVQLSIGRTLLYWEGGGVPQTMASGALIIGVVMKAYSEFSVNPHSIVSDRDVALNVGNVALGGIAIDAAVQGNIPALLSSVLFIGGNLDLAGHFENTRKKLSSIFGRVAGQVVTQSQTLYTAALGVAAYMAAGDATTVLPVLGEVPTSLLTFVPTAIGGGLALRNVVNNHDPRELKPFLWMSGGIGSTAISGFSGGATLPALAHVFLSSAYAKMQADKEGGYKALGESLKHSCQKFVQRLL